MMTRSLPQVDPERLYTVTEAARVLGVHRHTMWRYIRQGFFRMMTRKIDNRKVITGAQLLVSWRDFYRPTIFQHYSTT